MLKFIIKPCVSVYKVFKYTGKGLTYLFKTPNKQSSNIKKNKVKENREISKAKQRLEKNAKKLERKQKKLEQQRLSTEKFIEIQKKKEQAKLEKKQKQKQLDEQKRNQRIEKKLELVRKKREKIEKRNQLRAERVLERKKKKIERRQQIEQKRVAEKIKREQELALKQQKQLEKKKLLASKNKPIIDKNNQIIQQKQNKKEELKQIKADRKKAENEQKINKIREQLKIKEEETYQHTKARKARKLAKQQRKLELKQAKLAKLEARKKAKEELRQARLARKHKTDDYYDKNVKIDKPGFSDGLKSFNKKIKDIPKSISNKFKNNIFAKNRRNKRDINRQAMLIDFEGEDAKKSDVKLLYEYEAKDKNGKFIKGYFEAYSRVEVHSYLLSEGYEVYSIKTNKWISLLHGGASANKVKFKNKDLIFFLSQLSTYLRAGITLVEALKILSRQFSKQKKYKKIFESIIYELTMGENFSVALSKQNVAFPKLLINMIKTAEMTGELPEVLDDMVEYYTQIDETRRQFITAMTYPSIVFVFAIGVITFILIYVVPQFVTIYDSMEGTKIPTFTLIVINVSVFLKKYAIMLFAGIIAFIVVYLLLYKKNRSFRAANQWLFMHIPAIGNTIIYSEVATFSKTFSSMLGHNVSIKECMEILNKITNNEIYKMLILDVVSNLGRGGKISDAFENHWAFPLPAYEMICTGERTGELPEMLSKVSSYYQSLQKSSVTRIKTFIEPILTVFLTVIVGIIILAIVVPMFNMYQSVQDF